MTESSNKNTIAGPTDQISVAVAEAIAGTTGRDPASIEPPLYDFIDPDALDSLFDSRGHAELRTEGLVVFTMASCRVTVRSTGVVTARHLDDQGIPSTNSQPSMQSQAIASQGEGNGRV